MPNTPPDNHDNSPAIGDGKAPPRRRPLVNVGRWFEHLMQTVPGFVNNRLYQLAQADLKDLADQVAHRDEVIAQQGEQLEHLEAVVNEWRDLTVQLVDQLGVHAAAIGRLGGLTPEQVAHAQAIAEAGE